ncbi:septal ring lytic transglycosylase RlpA family protein [Deferrisoma palaeochoriense]
MTPWKWGSGSTASRLLAAGLLLVASCAGPPPPGAYRVKGRTYRPLPTAQGYVAEGLASWYGPGFHGRPTASGEIYDMYAPTAAHRTLPLGTRVRVTNLENGRSAVARINDRGPFVDGRIIDLSYRLAQDLGMAEAGVARVRVEALDGVTDRTGPFAWQVGAFTVAANAHRLVAQLDGRMGRAWTERFDRGDAVFHRVRVGPFGTREDADRVLGELRALGLRPFLVRIDP